MVCLDEATASVDLETDQMMQKASDDGLRLQQLLASSACMPPRCPQRIIIKPCSKPCADPIQVIKEKFASCTVLTVAHRIHTIIDADTVLCFDAGRLVRGATGGRKRSGAGAAGARS